MDKQIRELNKKIAALEKKINDAQNQIDKMEKIKKEAKEELQIALFENDIVRLQVRFKCIWVIF